VRKDALTPEALRGFGVVECHNMVRGDGRGCLSYSFQQWEQTRDEAVQCCLFRLEAPQHMASIVWFMWQYNVNRISGYGLLGEHKADSMFRELEHHMCWKLRWHTTWAKPETAPLLDVAALRRLLDLDGDEGFSSDDGNSSSSSEDEKMDMDVYYPNEVRTSQVENSSRHLLLERRLVEEQVARHAAERRLAELTAEKAALEARLASACFTGVFGDASVE
jgi:hypothetical protein